MSDLIFSRTQTSVGSISATTTTSWYGSIFTPTVSCYAGEWQYYCRKTGTPGNPAIEARIYATSDGLPTGEALDVAAIAPNDIDTSYGYISAMFTGAAVLSQGALYALIVVGAGYVDASNKVDGYRYSYGQTAGLRTSNSGESWSTSEYEHAMRLYAAEAADYVATAGTFEIGIGFDGTAHSVPLVKTAGVFDLGIGFAGDPVPVGTGGWSIPSSLPEHRRIVAIANNMLMYEDI